MFALHVVEQHIKSDELDLAVELEQEIRIVIAGLDLVLVRCLADRAGDAIVAPSLVLIDSNGDLVSMCRGEMLMHLAARALKIAKGANHRSSGGKEARASSRIFRIRCFSNRGGGLSLVKPARTWSAICSPSDSTHATNPSAARVPW